jgi:nucleotide-binding universal stress UspA family protein
MRMLIYAGATAAREQVLAFSHDLVQRAATSVTLLTGGGEERTLLLEEAAADLHIPLHVPVQLQALAGDPQQALIQAAAQQLYDLVILGRLARPLGELLPKTASKSTLLRVQPSVLRVHGPPRQIKHILLASGGDYHTFEDVGVAARLARPLGAQITIIHVIAPQSLIFEGFGERQLTIEEFLVGSSPEANTLRNAAALLRQRGITVRVRGRSGPVMEELLSEVRSGNYDLVVVGAHRIASPLDRILLEDISGDLFDISPLPVLVVKGHQSNM